MGQRANLLVATGGTYELYYTHHRANTLDHDLFWGPDYALGFIRAQRRLNPPEWLDDVWAEGGAVLDVGRRVLLWFGGEDIMYEVPLRRAHTRLMAAVWTGWDVRWAEGGIADMADYVGHPRADVLSVKTGPASKPLSPADALRPGDADWGDTIATVRSERGFHSGGLLSGYCDEVLFAGDGIVEAAGRAGWTTDLSVDWTDGSHQTGGFHLDVPARRLDCWTASPRDADVLRRVQERWPGWDVLWHGSRFESQLERADGHLTIAVRPAAALVQRLRSGLLFPDRDRRESGAEGIVSAARLIDRQMGMTVTGINPAALYDAQLSVPLAVRTHLFDAAVAATT